MQKTTRRQAAWAAAAVALAAAGCASIEAVRRSPATITDGVLKPARPPSPDFGADPTRTCPEGGAYGETKRFVAQLADRRGEAPSPADGQLCAVAEALLSWQGEGPPPEAIRSFLGAYFGSPNGAPQVLVANLDTADPRVIGEQLADSVNAYASKVGAARFGLAVERTADASSGAGRRAGTNEASKEGAVVAGKSRAVLVMDAPAVAIDPLPRRLAPGAKATLSGKLLRDFDTPRILVIDAQGHFAELPQAAGKAFKAELACGDRAGRIIAEIHGEDLGSDRALATLEVACGLPLPTSIALAAARWPEDVSALEAKMFDLMNADRVAAGLPALAAIEPVSRTTRAIAEAFRDVAKKVPGATPVDAVRRLADADLIVPVVIQNPGAGPSPEITFQRLMASPSHRANVMNAEVTHGAVGVATGKDGEGRPVAYVVQLLVKLQPPPDPVAMRKTILGIVAAKRAEEKLPALAEDATLQKLAEAYVVEVAAAGGPPAKEKTVEFEKGLQKGFRDLTVVRDARLDVTDYAEDPNVLGKGKLLGLATAIGRHPRLGKNTLFVVLVIANPIAGKPAPKK